MKNFLLLILLTGAAGMAFAQPSITAAAGTEVVGKLADEVDKNYVFPDKGKEMSDLLRKNMKSNKYSKITDPFELGNMLTADVRSVTRDKHLGVMYAPQIFEMMAKNGDKEPMDRYSPSNNYTFMKAEVLPGNIGYLKFDGFPGDQAALDVASAAMNFVANTDALIIDLRENGGGEPVMIAHICSYLFDEPVHLNSFYSRSNDKTTDTWTKADVPGKKMTKAPVYILMSNYTFSAAEEFAYDLQALERASIIGEYSGGGAHPVITIPLVNGFILNVPNERAINPITKTNWEGTGVKPDTETKASKALEEAHLQALAALQKTSTDPRRTQELEMLHNIKTAEYSKSIDTAKFSELTGTYGIRSITLSDGKVYFQRENGPKIVLYPLQQNEFVMDDLRTKVSFAKEADKMMLVITRPNGEVIKAERTKT